jgi:ribosome-binding ATPase YchF (GTP1/OBG family)
VPIEKALHEKLTGLGFTEPQIHLAIRDSYMDVKPTKWTKEDTLRLGRNMQLRGKPMVIAANKWDVAPKENIDALKALEGRIVVPTSAEFELALRKAAKAGIIDYIPGAPEFTVKEGSKLSAGQTKALDKIAELMKRGGSTGVQQCVEETVRKLLNLIVVYPVEDETHWTDKKGNVLPDAYLIPRGSTAKDMAFKVHTDLGKNFIRAINARTKMVVGHDYEVKDNDVLKIIARA